MIDIRTIEVTCDTVFTKFKTVLWFIRFIRWTLFYHIWGMRNTYQPNSAKGDFFLKEP